MSRKRLEKKLIASHKFFFSNGDGDNSNIFEKNKAEEDCDPCYEETVDLTSRLAKRRTIMKFCQINESKRHSCGFWPILVAVS